VHRTQQTVACNVTTLMRKVGYLYPRGRYPGALHGELETAHVILTDTGLRPLVDESEMPLVIELSGPVEHVHGLGRHGVLPVGSQLVMGVQTVSSFRNHASPAFARSDAVSFLPRLSSYAWPAPKMNLCVLALSEHIALRAWSWRPVVSSLHRQRACLVTAVQLVLSAPARHRARSRRCGSQSVFVPKSSV
jgi:hypothetical protein